MPSLEQSVKDQFAKVFMTRDWRLFKDVAEANFAEAAAIRKSSFKTVAESRRLLVRNTRKRLLIGIGAELLVKAVYLKSGYGINKGKNKSSGIKPPFKLDHVDLSELNPNDTFTFAQLTEQLNKVVQFPKGSNALDGLRIAKVFRNKEGHVVTGSHRFDPSNYRTIESTLVDIYACAFNEILTVRFSVANREKGQWSVFV